MSDFPLFTSEEYAARWRRLRGLMADHNLDGCLISGPENIFYLCGLSHQGFFAYHLLIVPRHGRMGLICRAMEQVTVEKYVVNPGRADFYGFGDSDDPAQFTAAVLQTMGLDRARLSLEKSSNFLPVRVAEGLAASLPDASFADGSGLVDGLRRAKSAQELVYTRRAAAVSEAMLAAVLDTAAVGVSEREIAAAVHQAMISAGGTYPGFGPFIRSTPTLGEEHRTWSDRQLEQGDVLFIELSGCVNHYHAPLGRLLFIGEAPAGTEAMAQVCLEAFANVVQTMRPGVKAHEVYQAWQDVVDAAGYSHYRRHHCGYLTGIGFPPSWVGGSAVVGLRHDSEMVLEAGMVFHLLSWLMGAGLGDYFVSDAAVVTETGCERLTTASQHIHVI